MHLRTHSHTATTSADSLLVWSVCFSNMTSFDFANINVLPPLALGKLSITFSQLTRKIVQLKVGYGGNPTPLFEWLCFDNDLSTR